MYSSSILSWTLFALSAAAMPRPDITNANPDSLTPGICNPITGAASLVLNSDFEGLIGALNNGNTKAVGLSDPVQVKANDLLKFSFRDLVVEIITIDVGGITVGTVDIPLVDLARVVSTVQVNCCDDISLTCPSGSTSVILTDGGSIELNVNSRFASNL